MPVDIHMNGTGYRIDRPLCGLEWLRQHIEDHTHAEIESLSIEVCQDGKAFANVKAGNGRDTVRGLVKLRR